jgi:ubiquinone/menaquinone biosynthesis C-methylase UbiE
MKKPGNNNSYYSTGRSLQRDEYFAKYSTNDGTTEMLVKLIKKQIKLLPTGATILDIGTGNGYLINEVFTEESNLRFIGLDNSEPMLEAAKKRSNKGIQFVNGDNYKLPFTDGSVELVIAKAVTNISSTEVYRVLKPGGSLVYKEYRADKGLKNVSKTFGKKFLYNETYADFIKSCVDIFRNIHVEYYNIPMRYEVDQLVGLLQTMRLIDLPDELTIRAWLKRDFLDQQSIEVVSDPFILVAKK